MHEFIFFDTETTSLLDKTKYVAGGEVIQFSAIFVNSDFEILRIVNRYCSTCQIIDPSAVAVHHLTDKKLEYLSGGKYFETIVEEEGLREIKNATWVGYNIGFDIRKVNGTLNQNGYDSLNFGDSVKFLDFKADGIYKYDAIEPMKSINKSNFRIPLNKLISAHIGIDLFVKTCKYFREKYSIIDPMTGQDDYFHNSFFDSLGLLLLINKYRNLLMI